MKDSKECKQRWTITVFIDHRMLTVVHVWKKNNYLKKNNLDYGTDM